MSLLILVRRYAAFEGLILNLCDTDPTSLTTLLLSLIDATKYWTKSTKSHSLKAVKSVFSFF